jgi:putative ABC transport system permease protein
MNGPGLLAAALDEVRAHRARALLATLSILVGVATLTLIVALGDVAQGATKEMVEREAGRAVTYQVATEGTVGEFVDAILPRLEARLDRYGVEDRSKEYTWTVTAILDAVGRRSSVIGVDSSLAQVRALRIVAGRWIEGNDDRRLAPVAVPNTAWVSEFGASAHVGADVLVDFASGRTTSRIVGVVDDGRRESRLYVPAAVMSRITGTDGIGGATFFFHAEPAGGGPLAARIQADLRAAGWTGVTLLRVDAADDFAGIFTLLQVVLGSIAAVSLVTGGLGILNLGLVTTRQRAREFAIRRSFGATRSDIFVMVMAESVWTTLIGGLLGVGAAAGLLSIGRPFIEASLEGIQLPGFPIGTAMLGLGVSALIGAVAGLLPARSATRVSIIDTIRA